MSPTPYPHRQAAAEADRLVRTDRAAGLGALQDLAESGDRAATVLLARHLAERPEDRAEALPWLMRAAALGDAASAWKVAMIHREGRRLADMRSWIDRAAKLGDEGAVWVKRNGYDIDAFPDFLR